LNNHFPPLICVLTAQRGAALSRYCASHWVPYYKVDAVLALVRSAPSVQRTDRLFQCRALLRCRSGHIFCRRYGDVWAIICYACGILQWHEHKADRQTRGNHKYTRVCTHNCLAGNQKSQFLKSLHCV